MLSPVSGFITDIDNLQMAHIARFAGAPMDKGAGVDLYKKLGDKVKQGQPLYRIYAEYPSGFNFALELSGRNNDYSIGKESQMPISLWNFNDSRI